ncbi:hypothetical protein [Treponema phagedenis]|uniref:hypothetical protein n=1 Tax=Treponema phagedenis TaxID=162 RepID=UPI0004B51907|nr:hypothetical protein [Treponema phagedenis]
MKLTENIELLHGDCLDFLPKIPDESIQSIITDRRTCKSDWRKNGKTYSERD